VPLLLTNLIIVKQKLSPELGRELISRGSTQIKPAKPAHLFGLLTGPTVYHTWPVMLRPFRVKLMGGFRRLDSAGDSQSLISILCWVRERLLVPIVALIIY